jgi:hypothetical protein
VHTLDVVIATMLVLLAVAAALVGAFAIVFRRAPRIPVGASVHQYAGFAVGAFLMAGGLAVNALGLTQRTPLVGLLGSLLMLGGIGATSWSRRAANSPV